MLRTPTVSTARRPKSGHRGSKARSAIRKTVCRRIASTHGPAPNSYWMLSARTAAGSVDATVSKEPSRPRVTDAHSAPGTRSTDVSATAANAEAVLSCTANSRPMSPNRVASPGTDSSNVTRTRTWTRSPHVNLALHRADPEAVGPTEDRYYPTAGASDASRLGRTACCRGRSGI